MLGSEVCQILRLAVAAVLVAERLYWQGIRPRALKRCEAAYVLGIKLKEFHTFESMLGESQLHGDSDPASESADCLVPSA